ncbi:MAG: Pr6Pr family membrane protein [Candidatus Heimdallarchaeota archaeon]|nr:Pr6Pr family membrane protein [Candidatus Heimdallarchaeota archaeon]MDH5645857.1 Pr6Pr family membrane protein [Candidatus Heimdallarchaeota archaeon]
MSFVDTLRGKIFYFRLFFVIISWTGIIFRFIVAIDIGELILEPLKFFTIQTNLFVATWLTLSILYKDGLDGGNSEKMDKLYGFIKGAVTSFITLTWIAFHILLSATASYSSDIHEYSSIINHYIIPIYFILDWLITERKSYAKSFPLKSLAYPLCYLGFALIYQLVTKDPIYGFLSIKENGYRGFFTMGIALNILFAIFCYIYLGLNKLIVKK